MYTTSMQENTDFTREFSYFELDDAHACSMMIYPTDSYSELDENRTHIICRTETIHDRSEIVQVLDCALYLFIQGAQVTFVSLHMGLSKQSTMLTATIIAYLGDDPKV